MAPYSESETRTTSGNRPARRQEAVPVSTPLDGGRVSSWWERAGALLRARPAALPLTLPAPRNKHGGRSFTVGLIKRTATCTQRAARNRAAARGKGWAAPTSGPHTGPGGAGPRARGGGKENADTSTIMTGGRLMRTKAGREPILCYAIHFPKDGAVDNVFIK